MVREHNIDLEVHISTQASILNHEAALFYKEMGATRVVLAREASKEDIKRIKEETGLEIECFAHGAMCTSISGRCVLSNYCTNRDSNRGGCAQICRWTFGYLKDDELVTDVPFSMTPKDLNLVSYIKDMIIPTYSIGSDRRTFSKSQRGVFYGFTGDNVVTVAACVEDST